MLPKPGWPYSWIAKVNHSRDCSNSRACVCIEMLAACGQLPLSVRFTHTGKRGVWLGLIIPWSPRSLMKGLFLSFGPEGKIKSFTFVILKGGKNGASCSSGTAAGASPNTHLLPLESDNAFPFSKSNPKIVIGIFTVKYFCGEIFSWELLEASTSPWIPKFAVNFQNHESLEFV